MNSYLKKISEEVSKAFEACGYDPALGRVTVSNRPDLCEYQCNGAMAGAKQYRKAPFMIADEVVAKLSENPFFASVESVKPGFININVAGSSLSDYLNEMNSSEKYGCDTAGKTGAVVIDYGGANAAKPLHVGHLRSAIIGESLKRIYRYMGHEVLGDVHLGDWGLQMGLIIEELKCRKPELPYFEEGAEGPFPEEAPFTLAELEEIYPAASAKSKEDEAFKELAQAATKRLQNGDPAYTAVWNHIMRISMADLKKNYGNLNVEFDLWKGESDAQPYIPAMVEDFKARGLAHESNQALVVDVAEETDTKEVPPCIILKSDGAALYATSDLATIIEREKLYQPGKIFYVVDNRQSMHFLQVFRTARKAGLIPEDTELRFIGFGTMNGKDGKPFKTRSGGVMRLEYLISEINEAVYNKIMENRTVSEEEAKETAKIIGLAALKYGDLSNQASKDYVFDIERFTSFEGNTGPYVLYTIVRIKSILKKYMEQGHEIPTLLVAPENDSEKKLMMELSRFNEMMNQAYEELAPHRICAYIFDLSNAFNHFYHETKILSEEDEAKKAGFIALINMVKEVLETCIDLLGFNAPDRM